MSVSVLMIVKSGVFDDARVRRAATALTGAGYVVEVIGDRPTSGAEIDGVTTRFARSGRSTDGTSGSALRSSAIARWLLLPSHRRRQDRKFCNAVRALDLGRYDIVHCNDLNTLELGSGLAERMGAAVVYDAHECWTGRREEGHPTPLRRALNRSIERRLGGRAAVRLTVSEGLAAWFADRYGWDDTVVVHNSFEAVPGRCELGEPVGAVYAGRIDRSRDLATVVAAFDARPDLRLDLVGPSDEVFAAELRRAGVVVNAPVAVGDLTERYRSAGIGLITLSGGQTNHRVALPNKLFQAVQAGVPVVAADLPELRRYVERYGLGALYEPGSAESLLAALDRIVEQYGEFVDNVRDAAPSMAWRADERRLLDAYAGVGVGRESRREERGSGSEG